MTRLLGAIAAVGILAFAVVMFRLIDRAEAQVLLQVRVRCARGGKAHVAQIRRPVDRSAVRRELFQPRVVMRLLRLSGTDMAMDSISALLDGECSPAELDRILWPLCEKVSRRGRIPRR